MVDQQAIIHVLVLSLGINQVVLVPLLKQLSAMHLPQHQSLLLQLNISINKINGPTMDDIPTESETTLF